MASRDYKVIWSGEEGWTEGTAGEEEEARTTTMLINVAPTHSYRHTFALHFH